MGEKEIKVTKVNITGKTVVALDKGQRVEEENPEVLRIEKK